MTEEERISRILKLWRSLFNSSIATSIFLSQKHWLIAKVNLFGRQMVSDQENKEMRSVNIPKWYIVMPSSTFYIVWQLFIVILLIYFATYIPFEIAFLNPAETQWRTAIDYSIDFLFFLDIVINFFTAYEI